VLFDRICRERGITHLLTGIRCPTTTARSNGSTRPCDPELLTGRRFDCLAHAQQVLDAWVADSNTHRPHQAIAMGTPAERFQPAAMATPEPARAPVPPAHTAGR
jgi:transposase InsO family protein